MTMRAAGMEHDALDPFAHFSLDTLVSATARLRPDSPAFHDRTQTLSYGLLATQVAALARQLGDSGIKRGERILLTGGAEIAFLVAIVAALRGGNEPVLAPLDLAGADLAAYASELKVAAIIGPSHYGDFSPAETFLTTAASVATIRLVASYGPEAFDGAVDLSPAACRRYAAAHPDNGLERAAAAAAAPARIVTLDRRHGLKPFFHRQSTLVAAGLDFAARAKIGRETPILSTLPLTSFAGLVAGPFAALLSGAALHLHGPFDARDFLAACGRLAHPHLVAPLVVARDFLRAGVMHDLASATLVSRPAAERPLQLPERLEAPCALVDLYAIGETAAVAESRRQGQALPPAHEPHYVGIDESRILAVAARAATGKSLAVYGAAVTAEA
jgi:acyl-CoA synthetase (AMP-forming)/AMP-acid ligase II